MAWRVADAADAFDSLSMPVPSRVYGPAEPSEAAVPRGASALLGASPSEPLAVAVARMVFRRMLAPGLIVTSARYVHSIRAARADPRVHLPMRRRRSWSCFRLPLRLQGARERRGFDPRNASPN